MVIRQRSDHCLNGRPGRQRLAAIVPAEFAATLEGMTAGQARELLEDLADVAAARQVLDELGEDIPAEQVWTELRVPDPGLAPGPALGKPADQSVTAPPQVWLLKVARAWILSRPSRLAMTFRTVNEPLGPAVVAFRETTTAPLSVIRTAHTWPARLESTWYSISIAPSSCLAFNSK